MDIGKISILQGPKKIIMKTEIWNGLTEKENMLHASRTGLINKDSKNGKYQQH